MEKTLVIDNKEVRFKSTGATPLRYKAQFHRDFFKDILKIDKSINNKKSVKSKKSVTVRDIENINFEILYNVVWVLAKTADKSIPEPMTWYDTFEDFDISEVFTELQDLILRSISPNSKKK
ncbi:hypothetical protein [Intestinibacter bartlettii]|jgi:hypothetical protein|uniref:hypothetical protein n=1 Tax=Intestinibacter bartlettii TaxID=261299 RepID=UPI0020457931|nr:MAG TPA: tail assembly chaperone protein [Caudoviricetes sp.]